MAKQPLVGGEETLDIVLGDRDSLRCHPILSQRQFSMDFLSGPWHSFPSFFGRPKLETKDKIIRQDSLKRWQEKLLKDGYTPGSVNAFVSAVNVYLDYIGHREYQLAKQLREEKVSVA